MPLLLSVLGHHSEPGDPVLIDWLIHLFQSVVSLGPMAIVIVLGVVIVSDSGRNHGSLPHPARQVQLVIMASLFRNGC